MQKRTFSGILTAHETAYSKEVVYLCIGISGTGRTSVARSWEAFLPPGAVVMDLDAAGRPCLTIDESLAPEGPRLS